MSDDKKAVWRPVDCGGMVGPIWFAAWLFTLGFVGTSFWKGVLALIIWPYLLGVALK